MKLLQSSQQQLKNLPEEAFDLAEMVSRNLNKIKHIPRCFYFVIWAVLRVLYMSPKMYIAINKCKLDHGMVKNTELEMKIRFNTAEMEYQYNQFICCSFIVSSTNKGITAKRNI